MDTFFNSRAPAGENPTGAYFDIYKEDTRVIPFCITFCIESQICNLSCTKEIVVTIIKHKIAFI